MAKILLVTGDNGTLASWQKAAAEQGHTLDIALSGGEALERAAAGGPAAVIIGGFDGDPALLQRELRRLLPPSVPCFTAPSADPANAAVVFAQIASALAPGRILVAEDDRQMSAILSMVLVKSGFEVRTVHDGVAALREIRSWQPHLLVLDIMLPVIDGFHVCQTINEDHSLALRPKVVIISGRGSDWDQNLGAACGAELYLVKPFSNALFLEKVKEIMDALPPEERR